MDLKSFIDQYRNYLISALIVIVLLVLVLFLLFRSQEVESTPFPIETAEVKSELNESEEVIVSDIVFVEVKGAVNSPGVYELPSDARVKNLLDVAVVSENADLLTVNQSMKLVDEMVVYIPYKGELEDQSHPYHISATSESNEQGAKVNINTADINALTTLNGIGEKKAQAIIEYREEFGLFSKLEDLMNISGIGEKTFENLEADITIN